MERSDPSQHVVDRLAEDIVERYRRGERPTVDEYVADYPDHAEELREVFPALIMLESVKTRPDDSGSRRRRLAGEPPLEALRDFRIVREVGSGGMGIVYEAEQESLGRRVALKVLRRHLVTTPAERTRFQREARAAARLHHTNIVPVFGVGQQGDLHYYVMQFIPGFGLDAVLNELRRLRSAEHPSGSNGESADAQAAAALCDAARSLVRKGTAGLDWRAVAHIGIQAADALQHAHDQGVLHRDVKPSNLMLDGRGAVWVTDFGLAKTDDEHDLTQTGDLIGTLRYMAPERFFQTCDARSDVYSLGLTLYEVAALRPAFDESQRTRLLRQILQQEPPRPRQVAPEIPRDLETIILKSIAREPARRYSTAADLAEDLRRFIDGKAVRARRATVAEIAWRWCRRNRLAASLLFTLAVVIVLSFAGITWKWREAERLRQDERAARKEADENSQQRRQAFDDLLAAQRLIERGREASEERRWDDAALAFTMAIEHRPEHQGAWDSRGMLHARLGLWDRARRDWRQTFELRAPEASWKWLVLGLLHLDAGDREEYMRLCARMRKRYSGTADPAVAIDSVRLCMALPDPSADPREMAELARTVAALHPHIPWYHYAAGLAEYRAGNDAKAAELFRRSRDAEPPWLAHEANWPLLALVNQRLGKNDEAEQALRAADAALDRWLEAMFSGNDDTNWVVHQDAEPKLPIGWSDWFEFRASHRLAHQVLRGRLPDEDVRLTVLRARALAGLRLRADADKLYTAALSVRPADEQIVLEAHRNRGYIHAEAGRWQESADEFTAAGNLRPEDVRLWSFRVAARLASGDADAYRRECGEMFRRFQETDNPVVAQQLVAACAVGPDALSDMTLLIPLGRLAASEGIGNARLWGAACYRAGHFDDARVCFDEAARVTRPNAWLWCFSAMTNQRLGRREDARRCLAEAEDWIQAANQRVGDDVTGDGPSWDGMGNRIDAAILLREAQSVVNGGA